MDLSGKRWEGKRWAVLVFYSIVLYPKLTAKVNKNFCLLLTIFIYISNVRRS